MAFIEGGFIPLPSTIRSVGFFRDDRKLAFFIRLILLKTYQSKFITWEGKADYGMLPNSIHTSIRKLSEEMKIPRSTVADFLNYFERRGFIRVTRSRISGLIIQIAETDAFRTRTGHQERRATIGKQKVKSKKEISDQTGSGHKPGHESGQSLKVLNNEFDSNNFSSNALSPDTSPDANPDSRSQSSRSFIDPRIFKKSQIDRELPPEEIESRRRDALRFLKKLEMQEKQAIKGSRDESSRSPDLDVAKVIGQRFDSEGRDE